MARRRTKIVDRGLEISVERAAFGLTMTGKPTRTRKRMTTLSSIADEMKAEAREIAMSQPDRTRRSDGGLAKMAPRHPFARSSPEQRNYVSSISTDVVRVGGRLAIQIASSHYKADEVEYGNAEGAVRKIRSKGKRFVIPVHPWKYEQIQKSRNLSLKDRRDRGWPSASVEQRKVYSDLSNAKRRIRRKMSRGVVSKDQITDKRLRRDLVVARQAKNALRARDRLSARAGRSRVIPMRGAGGRHYIAVTSFETYSEYGILRRAMNRIAIRHFE